MDTSALIDEALRISHDYWWREADDVKAAWYWDQAIKLGWSPTYPRPGSPLALEDEPQVSPRESVASRGRSGVCCIPWSLRTVKG